MRMYPKISREEVKNHALIEIPCTDYLQKAEHGGYVCIYCGSGTGPNKTGAVKYYKETNTCSCHACPDAGKKGHKFDVLDCMQWYYKCDYNEALQHAAERLGVEIAQREYTADIDAGWNQHKGKGGAMDWDDEISATEGPQAAPEAAADEKPTEEPKVQQAATESATGATADYREYYKACVQRITDPAAVDYLQSRGISVETALNNYVGFDPEADPANAPGAMGNENKPYPCPRIIIPTTKGHYVARSIDPKTAKGLRAMNPSKKLGATEPGIFNARVLYNDDVQEIFITEGAFDALSVIECGAAAIALNSTSNTGTLLQKLKEKPTQATLILSLDNDDSGRKATEELQKGLIELGANYITRNISGDQKDANDAIRADRAAFAAAIRAALDDVDGGKKAIEEIKQEISSLSADQITNPEDPIYKKIYERESEIEVSELEQAILEYAGIIYAYKRVNEICKQYREQRAVDKKEAGLPGLLTFENTVNIFQNADDRILEMKSFPEFSKTAKIHVHDTIALAAETGGGKSSLAINFLNDLNENYPCIYFNLEMDIIDVLRRIVSISSGMELDRIAGYKKDETTAASVNIELQKITTRKPLQVIQEGYSIEIIEAIIKQATAGREETTIIFIDHSLLVDVEGGSYGRYDRFTQVSEGLRKMALRYNVIIFVLLQQNRAGKAEEEERPKNSSLKESGSWENDSTCICFLWYDPTDKRKKLIITKNRHGECGEFTLNYWKKTQRYSEAKDQQAATRSEPTAAKTSKREKTRQKLAAAWEKANIETFGNPTLRAMAEAADVTTATVKGWIKEFGGCSIDGKTVDPAGIDAEVEYTGFIKLTPADNEPFDKQEEKPERKRRG